MGLFPLLLIGLLLFIFLMFGESFLYLLMIVAIILACIIAPPIGIIFIVFLVVAGLRGK